MERLPPPRNRHDAPAPPRAAPPGRALVRFYAELNDFVAAERRGVDFVHAFRGHPSVKDVIESLGVPHTEVDLVLVDGEPVGFSRRLRDGERVSVYPVFESLDISSATRVRPTPLREVRFVLDGHLRRLARYLRLLGFDARWRNDPLDEELARIASEEHRVLLTRDVGLLKRRRISHGCWIRATDPRQQLVEVVDRLDLGRAIAPFRRCLCCNALLEVVEKAEIADALPSAVRARHDAFRRCPSCERVYWEGSHARRMRALIDEIVGRARPSSTGADS